MHQNEQSRKAVTTVRIHIRMAFNGTWKDREITLAIDTKDEH